MLRYNLITNEVLNNATSNAVTVKMWRDQYGCVCVTHSGNKLSTGDAHRVMLQGSFDNTLWFTIETMSPADDDYTKQPTTPTGDAKTSWVRVVQMLPFMRAQVISGGGLTYNIVLGE